MKRFIEFLEELEQEDSKRVFCDNNGVKNTNIPKKEKQNPVFTGKKTSVNEEGEGGGAAPAIGGDVAPSVPSGPSGAPGPILTPGSSPVVPCVINCTAPVGGGSSHRPNGHRPPPPPPWRHPYRHLVFVPGIGTVKKLGKRKSKKNGSRRKPKNPY